ncbi:YihY/virulence factor BrkB family protein [Variovorax sp. J22R24]|uniref:YihY/virulence factor BrkB family protein n=1 Tax=Variovorax gracilis TaxID=3053502 RepID=UPI0025781C97|nr:YihY/virulence factor BrkB family protein [Variovorax sp. J22R24]MDM0109339.1 YihY/virulence factor BrkB family protein [Variovorax sp. J22R24]
MTSLAGSGMRELPTSRGAGGSESCDPTSHPGKRAMSADSSTLGPARAIAPATLIRPTDAERRAAELETRELHARTPAPRVQEAGARSETRVGRRAPARAGYPTSGTRAGRWLKPREFVVLCRTAAGAWIDDYAPSMGAAISYYTIFSMAPLLVIVIAVAGAVFGRDEAQAQVVEQISGLVGAEGASAAESLLRSASDRDEGWIAGLVSAAVLLVGATTVFAELQSALDRIWHVPEKDKPQGIWAVLRARILSFGLILAMAFLLIVSLAVSAGLSAFDGWFAGLLPGSSVLLHGVNEAISVAVFTLLFTLIFKWMPSVSIAWRDVWIGALVTALFFVIGKSLIGLYLGASGVNESFAAAGSLVVVVAWVYYAAQIFLFGAEFTKAYADAHGSLAASQAMAATEAQGRQAVVVAVSPGQGAAAVPDARFGQSAAARHEVDERLARSARALAERLVVLGALAVGNALVKRWIGRQRKVARRRGR